LTRVRGLPLPLTYNLTFFISLHTILELAVILGCYTIENTPKSVARIGRGASSIADNIKAFNKSPGAQAPRRRLQCSRLSKTSPVRDARSQGTGKELAMRSTAARWCSVHPDLACQAISMLQVICVREKNT
jgi:hypothetical protein